MTEEQLKMIDAYIAREAHSEKCICCGERRNEYLSALNEMPVCSESCVTRFYDDMQEKDLGELWELAYSEDEELREIMKA